jgi:3-deoxy-D-manno-octulosonic-acid transferase
VTSARLMAARLPPRAIHQFVPLDSARFVRRFLKHWRPGLGLFAESEIWPNMILEAARARVPLALVNARMSERSFRRWRGFSGAARALFSKFEATLAQTPGDAERLTALGARRAPVTGNLKFDAPAPPADVAELAELTGLVAGRWLWIAASTHPGEERLAGEAHLRLADEFPGLLTLIAPRHPERGAAVAAEISGLGLTCRLRSSGARPERDAAVYICDTVGELGLFYRLAGVAFLGRSVIGRGGQNPIEPAKLGAALLHGPEVANFAEIYAALDAEGGARLVQDADDLAAALADLFGHPGRLRDMARAAAQVVERRTGAVERTLQALIPQLAALKP